MEKGKITKIRTLGNTENCGKCVKIRKVNDVFFLFANFLSIHILLMLLFSFSDFFCGLVFCYFLLLVLVFQWKIEKNIGQVRET